MSETLLNLSLASPGPLQATGIALQERLRLVFPPRRFVHEWMPPRATKEDWKRLLKRMPFVGLGWSDADPIKQVGGQFVGRSNWTVFLVTRNDAGARGLYMGDAQGAGLFDMVHATIGILHGYTIPGVGSVQVVKAGNAFAENWDGDGTGMAAIDLSVGLNLNVADAVSGVPETVLATLGISWTFGDLIEQSDTIQTGASV